MKKKAYFHFHITLITQQFLSYFYLHLFTHPHPHPHVHHHPHLPPYHHHIPILLITPPAQRAARRRHAPDECPQKQRQIGISVQEENFKKIQQTEKKMGSHQGQNNDLLSSTDGML